MKLNVGAGHVEIDGWTAVDRKFGDEAWPLTLNGVAVEPNSVEEIRASHILEHFGFNEAPQALAHWVSCLQPGGLIRISVPDFDRIMEMRGTDKLWSRYLMGGQCDENDFHKSIWVESGLRRLMETAGLQDVQRWESDNTDTASHPVSLNLEGRKRQQDDGEAEASVGTVNICAVMSTGRYGTNIGRGAIESALQPFRIPLHVATGAYWSQMLQHSFEGLLDKDIGWVFTFDHDTMCTAEDLDQLMGIMGRNPHIDALIPLQARRHHETPLATVEGTAEIAIGSDPVPVDTGHFGCTLIRVDALKKVPLPWFMGLPTKWGSWNDNARPPGVKVHHWVPKVWELTKGGGTGGDGTFHVDPDIWFWKNWKDAGCNLYLAAQVRIGHMQEVVTYYDEHLEVKHDYVHKWQEKQKAMMEARR